MKSFMSILALLFLIPQPNNAVAAENIAGTWRGTLSIGPDFEMTVQFVISQDDNGSFSVIVSSPDGVGIEDTRANSVSYDSGNLKVEFSQLSGEYEGLFSDDAIEGQWCQEGTSFPLVLNRRENSRLPRDIIDYMIGDWYSELPSITGNSGQANSYHFQLTEDGDLEGVMDQAMGGETGVPLSDIEMTDDGELTFRITKSQGVFKGKPGDGKIVGRIQYVPGMPSNPQVLKKGRYTPGEPGEDFPEALKKKLLGNWHGELGSSEITFIFAQQIPSIFAALLEINGEETKNFPFTGSDIDGDNMTFEIEFLNAEFNGKLLENMLEGEWIQDGKSSPITLRKEEPGNVQKLP